MAECDADNDDNVTAYELYDCVLMVENDWRA
jgi:hypothetical protein